MVKAFREDTGMLKDLSFDTISATGPNGAHCHYKVDESTNRAIEPNSIYLVDSGGQYLDGTTDVTRTMWVSPGAPTAEMKDRFTREDVEPDERLMRSIEEKIEIPENRKDDFRREIMNYIGALAVDGKKFEWHTNDRLRRALELKLFEDQKDAIKLQTLVSSVIDKETQEKIDIIKTRMIKYFGYNEVSARDVLDYVASIYARGDAK